MSGRQKALLGVLAVLLVALFVVAIGAGRDDRGDPGARHGLVDRLGALGGERAAVDPGTVSADCFEEPGRLVFSGSCELRVADPGGLRTLVLRSAARFTVTAPAPGDADLTIRDEVERPPTAPEPWRRWPSTRPQWSACAVPASVPAPSSWRRPELSGGF